MVEVRMRQQNEINRRKVFDFQSAAFDSFEKEQPIGEVRVYQDVQICKLHQKRSVPYPGDSHLTGAQFWKRGLAMLPRSTRQQRFPDHLPKKRARIKMLCRRQVLK